MEAAGVNGPAGGLSRAEMDSFLGQQREVGLQTAMFTQEVGTLDGIIKSLKAAANKTGQ